LIFALDERGWEVGTRAAGAWIEALEVVLDLVDELFERGHSLAYSESIFLEPIASTKTFYDLYAPDSPVEISAELRIRIAVIFSRAAKLEDVFASDGDSSVEIESSGIEQAETIARVAARYMHDPSQITPCISNVSTGLHSVKYQGKTVPIWMVNSPRQVEHFFRWLIVATTREPSQMEALSSDAFRQLAFVAGSFDGIKRMTGSYTSLIEKIVHDLAFLSDNGSHIFTNSWQDAPSQFGAGNVVISDENGNTKQNRIAKRERKIAYGGADLFFWWHIKIEPHQNRIHICPDKVSSGGPIIVGIFCHHLTT
jgi:hypothetical protein